MAFFKPTTAFLLLTIFVMGCLPLVSMATSQTTEVSCLSHSTSETGEMAGGQVASGGCSEIVLLKISSLEAEKFKFTPGLLVTSVYHPQKFFQTRLLLVSANSDIPSKSLFQQAVLLLI